MAQTKQSFDTKEIEYPETLYVRDIENRVFQGIVLQSLAQIKGITLVEGNFIDSILNRSSPEGIKGIYAEQDNKNQSVSIKIEVNICYGEPIPSKAEEIQTKVTEEITKLTGLHVSSVHVVFKNVVTEAEGKRMAAALKRASETATFHGEELQDEYSEDF